MGEHKKILDWLSLNDTNSRHNDIRKQRQEGTGKWFLETETFRQWIQGSSDESQRLLWAYGIPGAGKTCISSLVIDHLHEHASKKNCGVAHIYFNYKEKQKQRPTDILTSLVKQLGNQQPEPSVVLLGLHERSQKEKRRPTDDELYNALVGLSKEFTRTFVVFDALDECDRWEQRATLLPMCHKMRESGLTLFITSRRSADDIEESFKEASTMEIRAHEADIRSYICKRLDAHPAARSMLRNSKREEGIITELVEISAGM
ncbi:hypothetical protein FN846DRAFT_773576 [Sphaerosporella brunnea]|uniref:Nephrocystin 3-like N-terminal domain-containing protein n=1 Tax=Sphaerosporella brunnea TaxID=1250544 RepID=A0A5J5F6S6_9PEZI|nr:hypothetical protein FN846DRAFT_773576 [Sphaerosporella brunnea]